MTFEGLGIEGNTVQGADQIMQRSFKKQTGQIRKGLANRGKLANADEVQNLDIEDDF